MLSCPPKRRVSPLLPRLTLPRLTLLFLLGGAPTLLGQASPTASRAADVQIGVGYTLARPGYVQQTFQGFAAYADIDLNLHLGVEAEFHQANSTNGDQSYQRTYEAGGRYFRTYGPLVPYVKAMLRTRRLHLSHRPDRRLLQLLRRRHWGRLQTRHVPSPARRIRVSRSGPASRTEASRPSSSPSASPTTSPASPATDNPQMPSS